MHRFILIHLCVGEEHNLKRRYKTLCARGRWSSAAGTAVLMRTAKWLVVRPVGFFQRSPSLRERRPARSHYTLLSEVFNVKKRDKSWHLWQSEEPAVQLFFKHVWCPVTSCQRSSVRPKKGDELEPVEVAQCQLSDAANARTLASGANSLGSTFCRGGVRARRRWQSSLFDILKRGGILKSRSHGHGEMPARDSRGDTSKGTLGRKRIWKSKWQVEGKRSAGEMNCTLEPQPTLCRKHKGQRPSPAVGDSQQRNPDKVMNVVWARKSDSHCTSLARKPVEMQC